MAEEKRVEEHEYTKTETDKGTSESHRDTVVEHDKAGKPDTVVEKETTIEKKD
jgi:hypothetical protein